MRTGMIGVSGYIGSEFQDSRMWIARVSLMECWWN